MASTEQLSRSILVAVVTLQNLKHCNESKEVYMDLLKSAREVRRHWLQPIISKILISSTS